MYTISGCDIDDAVKVLNDDGCYCQMKLYESQRPWKLDNENLKSRCKQLSDELGRHKQLLATTQDVSCFSLLCLCASSSSSRVYSTLWS